MFTDKMDLKPDIGELKEKMEEIIAEENITGKLIIHLIHAKKLIKADI
jgi:hypothetical protein